MNQPYLDQQNERAKKHLADLHSGCKIPILDLIFSAVSQYDDTVGDFARDYLADYDDWIEWFGRYADCPEELIETTIEVMQQSDFPVPEDAGELLHWASYLIPETLTQR